jgi:hypothetical protein
MRTIAALMLLGGVAFAKGEAAGTKVDVKGKYYETCACKVSCPCGTGKFLPSEGHCDALSVMHIDKGMVGKTKMDGLNLALVLRTPNNQIVVEAFDKGAVDHLAIYMDDKATDEQKKAFPALLAALLGTKEMKGMKAPEFLPIAITSDGETAKIDIGSGKATADIENIKIGETKLGVKTVPKHIVLDGAVPFPWIGKVTQGRSNSFHYTDGAFKWDYKDRNAYFGDFAQKATVAAAPAAAPAAPAAK